MHSLAITRLRGKTRRVVRILEKTLGTPRQPPRLPPPLDMLIATVLSQNTNDKNSHRAYTNLRSAFPTWERVANAPVGKIRQAIRIGGMANQKSVRIKSTLKAISRRFGSYSLAGLRSLTHESVLEELTSINGVGVKTAACVLLFSLGRDVFPVDTHVHRLCTRLGLARGSRTPETTFDVMRPLVPKGKGYSFHTNLIRFGRKVCRSANPACDICPLYGECEYPLKKKEPRLRRMPSRATHDFMLLDNV
ncbi:MAG: endonuclease III [Bacteroidota bacterium]